MGYKKINARDAGHSTHKNGLDGLSAVLMLLVICGALVWAVLQWSGSFDSAN